MKKFFKILRKIIKILLVIILFLISWVFVIITVALIVINNRTLKLYENEDGDMRFTMSKDFKVEDGSELVLNLGKGTIIANEIYDGEIDYRNIININLKKGIITTESINFENSQILGGYIETQGTIKFKKINLKDAKQTYKNGDIENWFEFLRFFVDGEEINYHENGQISNKQSYKNGIGYGFENGPYISYYWDGQIEEVGNYKDGEEIGIRTGYYDNGDAKYIFDETNQNGTGYYENGNIKWIQNKNGYNTYYENGNLFEEFNYSNGDIGIGTGYYINGSVFSYFSGEIKHLYLKYYSLFVEDRFSNFSYIYFDKNGDILGNYHPYNGLLISMFENGQIHTKGNYKNGEKEGQWTGYYNNGALMYERNYSNGSEDGPFVSYFENGQVQEEGVKFFSGGIYYGFFTGYLKDGTIEYNGYVEGLNNTFTGYFKDGIINYINHYSGYNIDYYENGNIAYEGYSKYGKLDGIVTGYYIDGNIVQISNYDGNGNYYSTFYNQDGTIFGTGNQDGGSKISIYKNGQILFILDSNGLGTGYYENGNIAFIGNYSTGMLIIKGTEYSNEGYILATYDCDGNGNGYKTYYNEIGDILGTGKIIDSETVDGLYINYSHYKNGQILEKGNYKNGEPDGYRVEYFEDGKVFAEGNYNNGKRVGTRNRYLGDGSIGVSKNYDE